MAGRFETGTVPKKNAAGLRTIEAMHNNTQPVVLWFPGSRLCFGSPAAGCASVPRLPAVFYCLITPQAIRLPEAPLGSVFISSAFSCTISEVPPLESRELGAPGCSVTPVSVQVAVPR